jgi:serpin B
MRILTPLLVVGFASFFWTAPSHSHSTFQSLSSTEYNAPQNLADANNKFAIELFKTVQSPDKNEFISPYSISSALAMTYLGAGGSTEQCMNQVLNFTGNTAPFHSKFAQLNQTISSINKTNDLELNIANRLWGAQQYKFNPQFLKETKKYYQAGLERINFEEAKQAAKTINEWVEQKTNNKIKDLLSAPAVQAARLVLTNAIYFNAAWAIAFNEEATQDQYFYLKDNHSIIKPFMQVQGWKASEEVSKYRYQYTEDKDVQVLEIPYADNKASMVVVLPKERTGLAALVNKLNSKQYKQWMNNLKVPSSKLTINLPKWTNTAEYQLAKNLRNMGMGSAFSDAANFYKMSDPSETPLKISEVIHKAFVEVSEKGTEAAAATAVIMVECSSVAGPSKVEPHIYFIANHPFLYFIKDNQTNSILFMGQVTKPE